MAKKNKIAKTTIATALVASAIIPVAVAPVAAAAEQVSEVVYEKDGKLISLSFPTFTDALNAEVLTDLAVKYVKAADGNYYLFETDFTDALNASETLDEALATLAANAATLAKELANVVEGTVEGGTVVAPEEVVTELKVESVSAINPTTIQVTFNEDVTEEALATSNYTLSKGTIEAVSATGNVATISVAGLTYGDEVTVTVAEPAYTKVVTVPEVSELFLLEIEAEKDVLQSDGASRTTITVVLKDRVTGEVVEQDGIVQFQATNGGLGQTTSALVDGKASVQLTSEASPTSITSILTATISDVPGAGEFKGLTAQKAIIFSPNPADEGTVEFVSPVYAEAKAGDRFFVQFSDKISAAAYKEIAKDEGYGIQIDGKTANIIDVKQNTDNALEFILDTDTLGAIQRIEKTSAWTGSGSAANYLRDNVTHTVAFDRNDLVIEHPGLPFILTDTSRPAVLGVTAKDQLEFTVRFTEAVDRRTATDKENFLIDGREIASVTSAPSAAAIATAKAENKIILTDLSVGTYYDADGNAVDERNLVTFKVHRAFALDEGTHQIQVANVGDYAQDVDPIQNRVVTDTFDFSVVPDNTVPVPVVEVQSAEQWLVEFDKPVYGVTSKKIEDVFAIKSADENDTFEMGTDYIVSYINEDGTTGTELNPTAGANVLDGEQYFLVEFTQDWTEKYETSTNPTKTYFASTKNPYVLTVDNLESAIGNKVDKKELNVSLSYDGQSPKIESAVQEKDNDGNFVNPVEVRVTMDEPVKLNHVGNTTVDAAHPEELTQSEQQAVSGGVPVPTYEFVKGDKVVKAEVSDFSYDNYAFTLTPDGDLEAGEWTLYIRSISDDIGNTSATESTKVTIAEAPEQDATATRLAWTAFDDADGKSGSKLLYGTTHDDKDVIYVKFTKVMKADGTNGVSRTQNYVFQGQPLPTGSQVLKGIADVTNDWDGVTIVMPKGTWNGIEPGTTTSPGNDFGVALNIASNFQAADGEELSGAHEVELTDTATTTASLAAGFEAAYADAGTQTKPNQVTFGGKAAVIGAEAQDTNSDGKIATIELKLDKESEAIAASTEILVNGKKFTTAGSAQGATSVTFIAVAGQEIDGTASDGLKVTGLDGSIIINTGLVADKAAPVIIDSALNDDRSKLTITFSEAIDEASLAGATYDLKTFKLNAAGDGFEDDLVPLTGTLDDFDPSKPNQLVLTLTAPNGNTISDTDVLDAIDIADLIGNVDGNSVLNVLGEEGTFAGIKNAADAEQVKVSLLAGAIADQTYSNNGNAAGLPTVPAGYTVKVLTSDDTDVYGIIPNGTLGDAGTSTGVEYEITHTASGKKGTSSPVTVTVTDEWQDAADTAAAGVGNQNFSTTTHTDGSPIYPNLPAGYIIAEVVSSSDEGVYALDGTLGTAGTSQVVYKITDANGRTSLTAPVTVTVAGDNIFEFELLPSIGAADLDGTSNSTKFGNYDVLVLAAGPTAPSPVPVGEQNKNIDAGVSNHTPDGAFDFKLTQNAGGLDTSNFMVLHNDQDGTYKIHINENGSSMNGDYVVDVTGKGISSYASFKQQFVYGTVGNDVTYAITAQDSDLATAGLSAEDVTVKWSTMQQANVTDSKVFILPTGMTLGAGHTELNGNITTNGAVNEFVGTTGSDDSAGNALVDGAYVVHVQNIGASGVLETLKVTIYLDGEAGAPVDTSEPVITAQDETVDLADLAAWIETVSATDDVDGTITGNVVATYFEADGSTALTDLAAAKTYIDDATTNTSFVIKYNVSDAAGNQATEVSVTITVTP